MSYRPIKPEIHLLQSGDQDFFLDCVDELYATIEKDPRYQVSRKKSALPRLKSWLIRKLQGFKILHRLRFSMADKNVINFASMISGDFRIVVPASFFSGKNYLYMYDVWPRFQHWIFPLLDVFNITYVFFSARQVAEDYQRKFPQNRCKAMWLPEALTVSDYSFKPAEQRQIDVLAFGRNYQLYHQLIKDPLAAAGKNYVYQPPGGKILFEGKAAFTAALSNSRVVICIPSNITHPERAEYISTMTLRYLQAMASKCLIIGMMPSDMEELFNYMPIVEIDLERGADQLLDVLANYSDYLPLIEKNYEVVKANHQWQNRWEIIQQKIGETL